MPEWWTYTLSDFLLFSPRTYYRMIQRYNAALWPGQIATLALALAMPWLRLGIVSVVLAVVWGWVAWAFLWSRYAEINWAARYAAVAFAIEVGLLLWAGVRFGGPPLSRRRDRRAVAGLGLFVVGVAIYPLLAPLLQRGWGQSEVFGILPDPTVLATLGVLLADTEPRRWWVLIVPLLWCVFSGLTLWAMGSPEAWILFGGALLAVMDRALFQRDGEGHS